MNEMAKTRSKRRSESQEDIEIETKVDDMLDEDDGSSSDEAPEMVVQSDAKEIEKRRMEMENLQRARYVIIFFFLNFILTFSYIYTMLRHLPSCLRC